MRSAWQAIVAVVTMGAVSAAWAQRSTPVQVLQPSGTYFDRFGSSVAVDGDTMVVASPFDDIGSNQDQGSAQVYRWTGSGWTFEATLTATGGAANDQFGNSVAISGDTLVVGASSDDVAAVNDNQGSAYVFTRTGSTWTQQAQLNATGGAAGDSFGSSVAISGDTVVVGASSDDVGGTFDLGSAYVFTRTGSTWTQQTQLNAIGGAFDDQFGNSVALSGDTVVVGASKADLGVILDQGSASVFTRIGSTWIGSDQRVVTSDGAVGDNVAFSAAVSGDRAIVGASGDDVTVADQGSAYIMTRTGTRWSQQTKLVANDPGLSDSLGISVAIDGITAVAGAAFDDASAIADQGSVYVFFNSSGTTWTQQTKLVASDGAAGDQLGGSVAISGNTLLAGAAGDDFGAVLDQGSAYVFTRTGTTWTQQAKLVALDGAAGDNFGSSVAILGDTAIVGASGDDNGAVADQGSIYIFTRSGTTWTQQAKLVASDGAAGDFFGRSLAIAGDSVIVGARADDVGANNDQGSAYVFTGGGASWTQQAKFLAADGAAGDQFGSSVSISGDVAIVGARTDDIGANGDQGSAYVFIRWGTTWTQRSKLTAPDGAVNDSFGASVGISGVNVLVGAVSDDVGTNNDQGSAWFLDVAANDLPAASNDVSGVMYPSLAAATLPAASGQQIIATEAAWRQASVLDTAGKSLVFVGQDDIRTSPQSIITLGGSSSMIAPAGAVIDLNGQLRVNGYGDLYTDAFRLGSRGVLTSRTNASLTINAPAAELDGQTRLEQGSSLTFAGTAEAIGSTTCAFESTLTAATSFTNIDTFTITAGTI
ncbi:MAG: hypothetical protein RL689_1291, partial [Planctomycetota bacterium]